MRTLVFAAALLAGSAGACAAEPARASDGDKVAPIHNGTWTLARVISYDRVLAEPSATAK